MNYIPSISIAHSYSTI